MLPRGLLATRLAGYLQQPVVDRALVIVGATGVGKTRLVNDVADQLVGVVLRYRAVDDAGARFEQRLEQLERSVLQRLSGAAAAAAPSVADVAGVLDGAFARETAAVLPELLATRDDQRRLTTSLPAKLAATAGTEQLLRHATAARLPDGTALLPPLALAYDLMVASETNGFRRPRSGRVVLPFLLALLSRLAPRAPAAEQFKLVVTLSERTHDASQQRESDFVDLLLLLFTEWNTKFPATIPVVIDAAHPYYAHALGMDFLVPTARVMPHSADTVARVEFLEAWPPIARSGMPLTRHAQVQRVEKEHARVALVPERLSADEFERVYAAVSGHAAHLTDLLQLARNPGQELTPAALEAYVAAKGDEFIWRLDECIARCTLDDGSSAPAQVLYSFMDVIERLAQVEMLVNVSGDYGAELLGHAPVHILLRQGLLLQLVAPEYLVPCSLVDQRAMARWLRDRKQSLGWWQRLQYAWYSYVHGVGPLHHMRYESRPESAQPPTDA